MEKERKRRLGGDPKERAAKPLAGLPVRALILLMIISAIAAIFLASLPSSSSSRSIKTRQQLSQNIARGFQTREHEAKAQTPDSDSLDAAREDGGVGSALGEKKYLKAPVVREEAKPGPVGQLGREEQEAGSRWAVPWSAGAEEAVFPRPGAVLNATCMDKMNHFIMHKIEGSSLARTMREHAKVFEVSPRVMLQQWGEGRLAALFEEAEESWGRRGAPLVQQLHAAVMPSAQKNPYWMEFAKFLGSGQHEKAVLSTSSYSLASISSASEGSGQDSDSRKDTKDPWPGMMVMYNARFWLQSVFVNDCKSVYASCCWGVGQDRNLYPPDDTCTPASRQPRYDKVLHLKVHKQRYFYHIVLEGIIRLAPFSDLLEADPGIQVAGLWALAKQKEIMGFLGMTMDRLLTGSGGGCANILMVPEHVPCEGPTRPMLHIMRGFIARSLKRGSNLKNKDIKQEEDGTIMLMKREGSRRSVENHDELLGEVIKQFAKHRIQVHTGKEPMNTQWDMFHKATAAAGPHGAGWANLVAMQPGAGVLEFLVPGPEINLCFMSIALKLGLSYRAIVPENATHTGSMRVNVEDAVSQLKLVVADAATVLLQDNKQ